MLHPSVCYHSEGSYSESVLTWLRTEDAWHQTNSLLHLIEFLDYSLGIACYLKVNSFSCSDFQLVENLHGSFAHDRLFFWRQQDDDVFLILDNLREDVAQGCISLQLIAHVVLITQMRCRVDRLPTAEQLEILVAWAERRAESSVTTVYLIHDPALELPLERCSLTAVDRLAAALGEHNLLKRILSQQVFMAKFAYVILRV
mmetsp:Transcript_1769/g.3822  ORF Transcript_1769/g.3822 Transcript_1769/m.3822 type:complete len:201 (+) Transcript_1769:392-994(+)